jgi:hypothetical protein
MTTAAGGHGGGEGYLQLLDRAQEALSLRADPRPWIEANLALRTKDQRVVPFRFRPVQARYWSRRTRWDVILKARQMGFTSLVCGMFFADTVLRPNTVSVMVAHDGNSSEKIFEIVKLFWERLPEEEKRRIGEPKYFTRREFCWPQLGSRFYVGTAGSLAFGRGQTINNLHCSEFAYWPKPEQALVALAEAVPLTGRIVIESTANGLGNDFHDLWIQAKQGESRFRPYFFPWWWEAGYRLPGPPLAELTEEEQQLTAAHGLDGDQLRWRREKRRQLREPFPQEYPENDGHCFLASGRCCFDREALLSARARIAAEAQPDSIHSLATREGESLAVAPARLLAWRPPEQGREYVIGADVGEGLAHGDASVGCVLDRETGEQVAELHGRVAPGRFARLVAGLAWWYREAELGVESNYHGHTVLDALANTLHYHPLYHHRSYDQRPGEKREKLGYPTNAQTKPIMIDDLAEAIAEDFLQMHSSGLVDECFTFVTTDSGSREAQLGKHDDRVMAAAIAWQVRKNPTPQPSIRRL